MRPSAATNSSAVGRYLRIATVTGIGNSVFSGVAVVVLMPLIVSEAGMTQYGTWAVLSIFVGFAAVADLGLSKAIVFLLPKQDNEDSERAVIGRASFLYLSILAVMAVSGGAVVLLGVNFWEWIGFLDAERGTQVTSYGLLIAMLVLGTSFFRALLEARLKVHFVNLGFMALTVLQYVAIYLAVVYFRDVVYMLRASAVVYTAVFVFTAAMAMRYVSIGMLVPVPAGAIRQFRVAGSFLGLGVLTAAVDPLCRIALTLMVDNPVDFGVFDIGLRIAVMANGLLAAFSIPLFGVFSELGSEQVSRIRKMAARVCLKTSVLFALGLALVVFLGRPMLEWWLGTDCEQLHLVTLILIAGMGLVGVLEPYSRALWALGLAVKTLKLRAVQVLLVVVILFATPFLEPVFRAAVAMSMSLAFYALGSPVMCRLHIDSAGSGHQSGDGEGGAPC